MADADEASLAAFSGGSESYESFLEVVPGAKQSAPELDVALLPFQGSLVTAPQEQAAAARAAADAAADGEQIRTDADVFVEVEQQAGRRGRIRGEFDDSGLEELDGEGGTVHGGRMNAPASPGRLAVDNFVEDEEEGEEEGDGYLAAVAQRRAPAAQPEPEPEGEAEGGQPEQDDVLAAVEERGVAEGRLWGPSEDAAAEWRADGLPGGCEATPSDGVLAQAVRGAVEELGDQESGDVDSEATPTAGPEEIEAAARQAELDALFEPEVAPAPTGGAGAGSERVDATKQKETGNGGEEAWEDAVEAFALDEDFDYDSVKLTPKFDLAEEKRTWREQQAAAGKQPSR